MKHLPYTLLAYFFNGIAVLIDKYLLTDTIQNPLVYVFYISCFSLIALLFLPYTTVPSLGLFVLASSSTLLWTVGAYFMYKALQVGSASRVIPVIGTFIPLILVVQSTITNNISSFDIFAALLLILGLVFLTIMDWTGKIQKQEVVFEVISSVFFAISYMFLHNAYSKGQFLTVLVWSRFVLIPVGISLVLIPSTRALVFNRDKKPMRILSQAGALFLIGQFAGGTSELLLTYSVSLANPALVNSLQGSQYVFLYIAGIFLSKKIPQAFSEKYSLKGQLSKLIGIILVAIGLYLLAFGEHH